MKCAILGWLVLAVPAVAQEDKDGNPIGLRLIVMQNGGVIRIQGQAWIRGKIPPGRIVLGPRIAKPNKLPALQQRLALNLLDSVLLQALPAGPNDGTITEVGKTGIRIDRGTAHGVTKGLRFLVRSKDRNVSLVEVTKVEKDHALARVVNPIRNGVAPAKGMAIANPLWSPGGEVRVHVVGRLTRPLRGVEISKRLDEGVSVVVIGQASKAMLARARARAQAIGAAVITERQLAALERKKAVAAGEWLLR